MKLIKKIFVPLMSIGVFSGLSVGATYALFTSSNNADVAITSGKVNATAAVNNLQIFSANCTLSSGEVVPGGSDLGVHSATYYYEDRTAFGTFIDGGTATLSGGDLTLNLIAPGDMVKAKFVVTNNSNIDVKYRLVAECTSTDDVGLKLFSALRFTALGSTKTNVKKYYTNWTVWTATDPIRTNQSDIKIEMPITLGNFYQNLSTNIRLSVEMVQANAFTEDNEDEVLLFDDKVVQSGSTPSGMKDTVLVAGGSDIQPDFKVEIPTGTLNEVKASGENVKVGDSLTLVVKAEPASSSIVLADDEVVKNFEIHVVNQNDELITSVNTKIKVYVFIGEDKEILRVYHKNVLITDYDYENGYVIYETADFSPFTIVLFDPTIEATIDDACYSTLAGAIADAVDGDTVVLHRNVVANESYTIDQTQSTIAIDLGGHKVTVNSSTNSVDGYPAFYFGDSIKGKSTFTLKNGTVEAIDDCYTGLYATNCTFNAEDLKIINNTERYFAAHIKCNNAKLTNVTTYSTLGGGFYADHGRVELFNCNAYQVGFHNHISTGLAAANGGVMVANNVNVLSENYGAYIFSSGGTITLYGGKVKSTGDKAALLAGYADGYASKINVIGAEVNGLITQASNAKLYVFEGKFNSNPTSFVDGGSTVTGPDAQGIYTVSLPTGKSILVYDDTYNHRVYTVNTSDLSANGKLISGDYALNSPENTLFIEDGYTYIGSYLNGFICSTKGSNSSTGSTVSMSLTRNSKNFTIYYSSLTDCLEEAEQYNVNSLTLRNNVTIEGNFACPYTLNGSSYTLNVTGTITGGTYGCKINANAISGGTFNSSTAPTVTEGGITGGSFKALPAASALANNVYVAYENSMFTVTNNVSQYNCYYVANDINVYGNFDTIYTKGNITLLSDVTTTCANGMNYYVILNGHSFALNNANYTAVTSKDSTKALIVNNSLVSEGKLNLGSYRKNGANLSDYPIVTGCSAIVGYSNYIVRTDDLDNNGLLYKGIYSFDMLNVFAEGYDDVSAKDTTGNTAYLTGKNIEAYNNKIISGTFHMNPSEYVAIGKVTVTESGGIWTVTPDESKAVAQLGDKKYLFIGQAIAAASSGDTVTLLCDETTDSTISFSKANITLDLNDHTLIAASGLNVLFSMPTGVGTVKNGTVECLGFVSCSNKNYKLTVDNVDVTCTTLIISYYKGLNIVSGTFTVDVTNYVASGSSIEKVGEVWVVTKNA